MELRKTRELGKEVAIEGSRILHVLLTNGVQVGESMMRVVDDLLATLVEYRDLLDRQKVVYPLLLYSNYRMAT